MKTKKLSRKVPLTITPGYLSKLKILDWTGRLNNEQIPIAKAYGLYQWDSWKKEERKRRGEKVTP